MMHAIYDNNYYYLFLQFHAFSKDYFGNRLRQYELNLRLELSLTHGYNKTAWPYFGVPTEANAGYLPIINLIGKHSVIGKNIIFGRARLAFGFFCMHAFTHAQ